MKYWLCLIVFALLLSSCGQYKNVVFDKMDNVKLKDLSLLQNKVTLTADAIFYNPNDFNVKVTHFNANVYLDDKTVGMAKELKSTSMRAKAHFLVPIEMEIPLREIVQNARDLLKGVSDDLKIKVRIDGDATIDVLGQALTIPFESEQEKGINL